MAFYYHKDVVMTVYFYRTMWWKTKSVWLLLWICPGIYHERVIFMFWLFLSSLFKNNICVYLCVCVIHVHVCAVAQSCLTFCDLMDCSPPGSFVCGIILAGILEWVAISSSRGSSWSGDRTCISHSFYVGKQIFHLWATWEAQSTVERAEDTVI